MDLFDGDRKGYIIGAVAGLAATTIVREVGWGFRDLGRPVAKATIKSGIALMDKSRELLAHLGEVVEDLVVEARLELDERHTSGQASSNEAGNGPEPARPASEVH